MSQNEITKRYAIGVCYQRLQREREDWVKQIEKAQIKIEGIDKLLTALDSDDGSE